jgi:hypothetical protein
MKKRLYGTAICFLIFLLLLGKFFYFNEGEEKQLNSPKAKSNIQLSAASTSAKEENLHSSVHRGQKTESLSVINENSSSSKSADLVWRLEKFNEPHENSLRISSGIGTGVLEKVNINTDLINKLSIGDVVNLTLPNSDKKVVARVSNVSVSNDVKTIVASIDGLGIGYGVTLSLGGSVLAGDIINESGSWSIDTVSGITFITNGRKSNGLEHDVAP